MTTIDENVNWMKLTHLLSNFSLNLRAFFCTSNFTSKKLIAFLDVHNRENLYLSLMYIVYTNASNNAGPSYTHIGLYMV